MHENHPVPLLGSAGPREKAITILIVDDNPMVRYGIRRLLEQKTRIQITAESSSCQAAWGILGSNSPCVLLIDIDLKDGCAHKLIARVVKEAPQTRILVYSAQAGDLQIIQALRSGAHGYLTKDAEPDGLLEAIRAIVQSGSYLDPAISSKVIGQLGRAQERRVSRSRHLTQRESAVLQGVALGKRNRDIASDLFITERTVKYHLTSMFAKLRVSNRTEAVKYAFEHGFIK